MVSYGEKAKIKRREIRIKVVVTLLQLYKTKYSRNLYLPILKFQEKTDEVTNKFLDKRKDSYQSKPQPLATVHIDEDLNEIKHTVIYF